MEGKGAIEKGDKLSLGIRDSSEIWVTIFFCLGI
jgi:hypothetical protein